MRLGTYNLIRLAALALTLLVICGHFTLPEKRAVLFPFQEYPASLYHGDSDASAKWVNDTDKNEWLCVFSDDMAYSCGFSVSMGWDDLKGANLSGYSALRIHASYQGSASRIRVFLRNFNSRYSIPSDMETTKFMSTMLRTSDLNDDVLVQLTEFSVAEWWVSNNQVARELVSPEFKNILTFGIDYIDRGTHLVKLDKVEAIGLWITHETLYLLIIAIWALALIVEAAARYYTLYRKSQKETQLIEALVNTYQKMDSQRYEAETASTTDALTGVMNRNGLNAITDRLFREKDQLDNLALILFDIDYFKKVNDRRGHDAGDRVLKDIAVEVKKAIRKTDIFARWGGEEFLILTSHTSEQALKEHAENIRHCVQNHIFEANSEEPLFLTISLGACFVEVTDSFDTNFKCADKALYSAKSNGRNCAVIGNI